MRSVSDSISAILGDYENSRNRYSLHQASTEKLSVPTSDLESKKKSIKEEKINQPAVIVSISPTNVLISSEGNLYRSNTSWNKVL
jgi:hypothetical protein